MTVIKSEEAFLNRIKVTANKIREIVSFKVKEYELVLGKTEDTSRKTYEKACELQLNCFIGLHRLSQ